MKKLIALFATLAVSLGAQAAKFTEGENYQVLDSQKSATPMVTEFFSFYCPHCYSYEPLVKQLKTQLPSNVKFEKAHVSFMGGEMGPSLSKAYATMLMLKVEDKMVPVLFERIQDQRKPPRNDQELRQLFVDHGIDGGKFDGVFNSFMVDSMVRRFDKQFSDFGLRGVPATVVNNKYLVQAKSAEEYFALVHYLLKK